MTPENTPSADSSAQPRIYTLQLGMDWLPEAPGGLTRLFFDIGRYLPQVGVEVRGLVTGAADMVPDTAGRIRAFAPSDSSLAQRWWRVRQAVKGILTEEPCQLVVSHFALYGFPVLDLLQERPLVVHFHGPWQLEGRVEGTGLPKLWLRRIVELAVYRKAAGFIVLSQHFRNILHREYQIPLGCIRLVPGGVDMEHFAVSVTRAEARQRMGWPNNRPIILAARRMARRMGLDNLVDAMQEVRRQVPEVLLLITGKGPMENELAGRIKAGDLDGHVHLVGHIPEALLPLAYRAADLSVVPTTALEGFGLSVVESLAAGTPVLGTPVGGMLDILPPLSDQLILEGTSPDQLAHGIGEALSGRRHLPNMEQCQTYARLHFAWPLIARKIREVYEDVLEGRIGGNRTP